MTLVSVIIPIYNTEKYLKQCLNSVLEQTLTDIEIICINDGSEDNSLNILKEYSQKDKRVKVINLKTNKGVSYSRNIGIQESKSPYIFFLDSDDNVEASCLEILYKQLVDIKYDINFGAYNYYNNEIYISNSITSVKEFLNSNENYSSYCVITQICGKMFSKDFIQKNNIIFNEELSTSEDFVFIFKAISLGAKITAVPIGLYNYHILRNNSITSNIAYNNTDNKALEYFINSSYIKKFNNNEKIAFINTYMQNWLYWYDQFKKKEQKKDIRKAYKLIKKHFSKELLAKCPHHEPFKNIAKTFWQNILSLNSWKRLFNKYFKSK